MCIGLGYGLEMSILYLVGVMFYFTYNVMRVDSDEWWPIKLMTTLLDLFGNAYQEWRA